MKKLLMAAMVAGSLVALAEEAAPAAAPAPAMEAVKAAKARRGQLTPEQRAEMRAKREKFIAERKAQMEAKMLEVVKKYVPEEEKAKALVKELQAMRMQPRRPARPAAQPASAKAE